MHFLLHIFHLSSQSLPWTFSAISHLDKPSESVSTSSAKPSLQSIFNHLFPLTIIFLKHFHHVSSQFPSHSYVPVHHSFTSSSLPTTKSAVFCWNISWPSSCSLCSSDLGVVHDKKCWKKYQDSSWRWHIVPKACCKPFSPYNPYLIYLNWSYPLHIQLRIARYENLKIIIFLFSLVSWPDNCILSEVLRYSISTIILSTGTLCEVWLKWGGL
jgi:hypothetical protein